MRKCAENIDGESSSRLAEHQGPLCREKGSRVNVLYPTPEDKIKIVPTTETLLEEARLAQESSERTAQTPAAKAQLALTGQAIMEGEALGVAEKVTDEARRVFWEFQT